MEPGRFKPFTVSARKALQAPMGSRLLAFLALLAFWAVALRRLGAASFWYDEIFNADLALNFPIGEVLGILRTGQPYPPIYLLLLKGWAHLTGARPYMPGLEPAGALEMLLRFPGVAATMLALATLFPLGRRLGLRYPHLAPLLLALHPTLLTYARDVRMYPLWALLLLLALLGLAARRPLLWLLAGSAALLTHYFSFFPLAAAALAVAAGELRNLRRGRRPAGEELRTLLLLAMPFIPAGLWALWALPVTAGFGSFATSSPPTLAVFLRELGPEVLTAADWLAPLSRALPACWGNILLVAGVLGWLWIAARSGGRVGAAALLLGALGLFLFWQVRSVHHSRYLFWTLPLIALGVSALVGGMRDGRSFPRAVRWGQGMLALVVVGVSLAWGAQMAAVLQDAPRTVWYPDFRQAAALVNARARPGDCGLTVAAHGIQALRVYRTTVPFAAGPEIGQRVTPEDGARLAEAHRPQNGGRFWLLLYQDGAVDPGGGIVGTLEEAGGYRVEMLYSRELRLYAYALPEGASFRPLEPRQDVGAIFSGGIVLRGATVHREGRLMPVYLFWELTAPQERGWTGSVHLVRQVGERPITQWDKPVLNEYWPLPRLPVGELLPDRYELVIPPDLPPGTYTLYALLYDPTTGARCPLEGGGELAILGTVEWK